MIDRSWKIKIISWIDKNMFLSEIGEEISDKEIVKIEDVFLFDNSKIFMLIAKTDEAKKAIKMFYSPNPDTFYKKFNWKSENNESAKYSIDKIKKLLGFFEFMDENVEISLRTDYPMKIENDDFAFILGPIVED